jgi:hypothetical protein
VPEEKNEGAAHSIRRSLLACQGRGKKLKEYFAGRRRAAGKCGAEPAVIRGFSVDEGNVSADFQEAVAGVAGPFGEDR